MTTEVVYVTTVLAATNCYYAYFWESTLSDCSLAGWKILLAGSLFPSSTEQRYAQLRVDVLLWHVILVVTDHKPLVNYWAIVLNIHGKNIRGLYFEVTYRRHAEMIWHWSFLIFSISWAVACPCQCDSLSWHSCAII